MKKVLVIEDYEIAQRVMKMMISDMGCKVDIAGTGMQALELFKNNYYHLIFVDIGLPDMDGFTVVGEMRKIDPKKADIPIIVLSAYSDIEFQNKAKLIGLNEYIVKPLMAEDCARIINQYIPNIEECA